MTFELILFYLFNLTYFNLDTMIIIIITVTLLVDILICPHCKAHCHITVDLELWNLSGPQQWQQEVNNINKVIVIITVVIIVDCHHHLHPQAKGVPTFLFRKFKSC